MMKYICGTGVISTHYEVKQFLKLERLNQDVFDPSKETKEEESPMSTSSSAWNGWSKSNGNMSPSDFNYIMKIGKGSFGHVFLAKKLDDPDNKYYAIKILDKALIMGEFSFNLKN